MDDDDRSGSRRGDGDHRSEPVRSRWTPKPEQILILESIFNSGMVNPPKDETVRIRKHLEKFGSVGDANVFYWFQNRRSRSRRRQRQIQASLSNGGDHQQQAPPCGIQFDQSTGAGGFAPNPACNYQMSTAENCLVGSSSSTGGLGSHNSDDFFSFSGNHHGPMQEYEQSSIFCPSDGAHPQSFQSEVMTVFINGVATEVARGPLDLRAMCGGDLVLVHSSGLPVQLNEYGFVVEGLQYGESYFLVPRHS